MTAPTTPPSVDTLPPTPVRGDRTTFRSVAETFFSALATFRTQLVALATNAYDNCTIAYDAAVSALSYKTDAEAAKDAAVAVSDYRGSWSDLTGSFPSGASVYHDNLLWFSVSAIADITASEPSLTNSDWSLVTGNPGDFILDLGTLTGGTQDIDIANGLIGKVKATISTATQTFTVSNVPSGKAVGFVFDLTNAGSQAINFMSDVEWAGGSTPTLTAAGRDRVIFDTDDGGTIWTGTPTLDIKAAA